MKGGVVRGLVLKLSSLTTTPSQTVAEDRAALATEFDEKAATRIANPPLDIRKGQCVCTSPLRGIEWRWPSCCWMPGAESKFGPESSAAAGRCITPLMVYIVSQRLMEVRKNAVGDDSSSIESGRGD